MIKYSKFNPDFYFTIAYIYCIYNISPYLSGPKLYCDDSRLMVFTKYLVFTNLPYYVIELISINIVYTMPMPTHSN